MSAQNNFFCPTCNSDALQSVYPQYTGRCVTSQMEFWDGLTFANFICKNCGFIFNAKGIRGNIDVYSLEHWTPRPLVVSYAQGMKGQQERAFEVFSNLYKFPKQGSLLDFGAGTGGFLNLFSAAYPEWELFGIEPGRGYLEHAKTVPQATSFNSLYMDVTLPHKVDVIAVMSVLEHVENPLHALRWIVDNLKDDGTVLLRHPDFVKLPGDVVCVDHQSKLTMHTLRALCSHVGLDTEEVVEDGVLFAMHCTKNSALPLESVFEQNIKIVERAEQIAKSMVASVEKAIDMSNENHGKMAIFGTSPIGYMAQRLLGHTDKVVCFVDENPNVWNTKQDGIPIIAPSEMENYGVTDLAIVISPIYWDVVNKKMQQFNVRVHVPCV